jgi:hypothetical protein
MACSWSSATGTSGGYILGGIFLSCSLTGSPLREDDGIIVAPLASSTVTLAERESTSPSPRFMDPRCEDDGVIAAVLASSTVTSVPRPSIVTLAQRESTSSSPRFMDPRCARMTESQIYRSSRLSLIPQSPPFHSILRPTRRNGFNGIV